MHLRKHRSPLDHDDRTSPARHPGRSFWILRVGSDAPFSTPFKGGIWHEAKPWEGSKVVYACGEACFLQRFWTTDDFVIANGYSVANYPKGIQFDINQIERTFHPAPNDYGWNLDFMMGGPGRRSLVGTGRKVAWELKESVIQDDGSVRQSYLRSKDDRRWTENEQPMFEHDGIMELIWMP